MAEENTLAKYTKLSDDNFYDWRFQLQVYCNSKEAIEVISTPFDASADATTKKKYQVIYSFICLTCSVQQQRYLHDVPPGDAHKAYQALAAIYEAKSTHSIFQLVSSVVLAKQNGRSAIEFTTAVSNDTTRLRNAIKEQKLDIFDVLESSAIISGVDSAFNTTIEALLVSGESTILKVRSAVLERAERIKSETASDSNSSAMSAMMTNGGKPKPSKPCAHCLEKKHKALYHYLSDCYDLHPEKRPTRPNNRNGNNGRHTFQGNAAEADNDATKGTNTVAAWPAVVTPQATESTNANVTTAAAYKANSTGNKLIAKVDSGAHGVDLFLAPNSITGLHHVSPVNVKIAQLGQDPVVATHEGMIGNVKGAPLRALTGPNITTNLLSVHGLAQRGIGVYLSSNKSGSHVLFIDEEKLPTLQKSPFPTESIVHRGFKKDGEYLVELTIDSNHQPKLFGTQPASADTTTTATPTAHRGVNLANLSLEQRIYLLHCRLSHRSPEQLHELVEHHCVGSPVEKGVPVTTYVEATRNCPICPLSKMRGRPHHHHAEAPLKRTLLPYSYMHIDILNMGKVSYGGNKYLLNMVDEATNSIHPLPLKAKSDLTTAVDAFHRRHVKPFGLKIDDLKLDRAGEQRSREFEELCAKDSIVTHYTSPGDSRANGKVERANLTISTDALSLRLQGNLSRKSWAELSRTAALINNHLPTSANPNKKSPQEMLNAALGRSQSLPDISKLRTIGSKAFAYVHPKHRREGDNKAIEGVLVGYTNDLKGYRVMAKGTTTIIESDHVDIHEVIPGHDDLITNVRPTTITTSIGEQPNPPTPHIPAPPAQQPAAADNRLRVPAHLAPFLDPTLLDHADEIGDDNDDHGQQDAEDQGEQQQQPAEMEAEAPVQRQESGIPVWRSRRQTRSQAGGDSLRSLGNPTAHFLRVVLPTVKAYDPDITAFNRKLLYLDPTAHTTKSLLTSKPYTEAVKEPGAARGMLRELVNVVGERKMEIIKRPTGVPIITSTWTHKPQKAWKLSDDQPESVTEELRSRLCPRGYQQSPESYNPDQIEAPTPRPETVKVFHALTVNRSQKVVLVDEKSAFSNTPLDPTDEIYMTFPDGMVNPNGEYCLRLVNSINGIKQAGNNYYRRTAKHLLESEQFRRSTKDPCYFYKWDGQHFIQVLAWVDDIRVSGDDDAAVDGFVERFQAKFQCKVSDGSDYLGTEVLYDRAGGVLTISVKKKIQELLAQFGMTDCRPVSTPAVPNTTLERPEEGAVKDPEVETFQLLSGVYSAYWIALTGKQEILYAIRDLSLYTSNFDISHVQAFKHLLRYLKGQLDNHLVLRRGTPGLIKTGSYADADFAGSPERSLTPMRSTSGIALYLVGIGLLLAICKGQPTIARSTAEAEYRSSGLASVVIQDMNDFLAEIGFSQDEPTVIYQDNHACIKMTKSLVCGSKSRHIKIEHHYIRELVANKQIVLVYCPTSEMVADLFTKNLPKPVFEYLRNILYRLL